MPELVVDRMMRILNHDGKALRGAKVAVLGVAYKKDIDDVRESPVLDILTILDKEGADYTVVDPFVPAFRLIDKQIETVALTEDLLSSADLVLIATDHTTFDYEMIANSSRVVFDTRNALKDVEKKPERYIKL
jgi:UDP-N-acetyl-D-glucosamine dehydrogenase